CGGCHRRPACSAWTTARIRQKADLAGVALPRSAFDDDLCASADPSRPDTRSLADVQSPRTLVDDRPDRGCLLCRLRGRAHIGGTGGTAALIGRGRAYLL